MGGMGTGGAGQMQTGTVVPLVFAPPIASTVPDMSTLDAISDGKDGLLIVGHGAKGNLLHFTGSAWAPQVSYYSHSVGAAQIAGPPDQPSFAWATGATGEQSIYFAELLPAGVTTPIELDSVLGDFTEGLELHHSVSTGKSLVIFGMEAGAVYSEYFDGANWQPPVTVGTAPNSGLVRLVHSTMDAQGRAAAIWEQRDGTAGSEDRDAVGALFDGSTWQAPVTLANPGTNIVRSMDVSVNAEGKGFAVWGGPTLSVCPVDLAKGWGTPSVVSSGPKLDFDNTTVAVNSKGQAVVLWKQEKAYDFVPLVMAAYYDPTAGWTTPQLLHPDAPIDYTSKVAIDEQGRAVVAFHAKLEYDAIWVAHYLPNQGFSSANKLFQAAAKDTQLPNFTLNLVDGKVLMSWIVRPATGAYSLQATTAPLPG